MHLLCMDISTDTVLPRMKSVCVSISRERPGMGASCHWNHATARAGGPCRLGAMKFMDRSFGRRGGMPTALDATFIAATEVPFPD